jgi:hypothetical protein
VYQTWPKPISTKSLSKDIGIGQPIIAIAFDD